MMSRTSGAALQLGARPRARGPLCICQSSRRATGGGAPRRCRRRGGRSAAPGGPRRVGGEGRSRPCRGRRGAERLARGERAPSRRDARFLLVAAERTESSRNRTGLAGASASVCCSFVAGEGRAIANVCPSSRSRAFESVSSTERVDGDGTTASLDGTRRAPGAIDPATFLVAASASPSTMTNRRRLPTRSPWHRQAKPHWSRACPAHSPRQDCRRRPRSSSRTRTSDPRAPRRRPARRIRGRLFRSLGRRPLSCRAGQTE